MKTNLLLCLLLLASSLAAQERGVTPVEGRKTAQAGTTRAVVIGISDYQDEGIPDLKYAHKDAEVFAAFLQSPAGGSIPAENLTLLLNEKATRASVVDAFYGLMESSEPNDQAIIYFSGHGDVETVTRFNRGYLLTYDSPPQVYMAGAFNIRDLQDIISTLSDKNVQVIMISDACRAGKLAGEEINGSQATARNLSLQFANEVKILSCQPNEFSLEGEQWGGGRGAFSYHLLDGLQGLADKNADAGVSLFEIGHYLDEHVPAETAPHSQMPLTVGDRNARIATVDPPTLARLREQKASYQPQLAKIDTKGMEDRLLAGADSSIQEMYAAFELALEHKQLLEPAGASAYDLYQALAQKEEIKGLHNIMRRRLSVALQDDAQQAVNAYLAANPTELQRRFARESDYNLYPRYLEKAAELLGPAHFYYNNLMAQKYYFEGLRLRLDADNNTGNASYTQAIEKQLKALEFQERAPFVLNELGVLHTRIKSGEQAVAYYQKTIELAPEWGLPYVNLCLEQFYNNDTEKAMETGEKALALMPDYPQLYNLLGWINANYGGAFRDKRSWTRRGVELSEDFRYDFDNQSSLWQLSAKFQKTIDLLEKAVEIDSTFTAAHYNLGPVYIQAVQYEKAVSHLKKAVLLDPENEYAFSRLGHALKLQAQFEASEEAYKKAIALARAHTPDQVPLHYNSLGLLYALWGNRDKAKNAYQKAIELNPNYGYPYGGIAHIYALEKDFEEAEGHCLKYVEVFASAPEAYLSAGNFYKSIDRYQDAEWMFLKAIEIYPDFTADRTPLTDLYQKTGDFAKALVWQEKRLEAAPDDPLPHLDAGKLAYLNKQKSQAKAYFDKAVELGVNFQGHLDITRFCLVHSEYDWAEYYAQLAQSIDPNWYILYELLAWIYYLENRPDEAQKVLDEGIVLQQPIHNKAHLNVTKALIYYFTGDGEKCMQYFQKAEAVDPTNIYFIGLGFMGERLKEKDYAAVDSCLTIYNARIGTRESLFINAVARAQLGHQEGGIEALKRSLEVRMPSNGISYDRVSKTPELEPLREAHAYQEMMRRHFPEKYDDLDTFEFTKPQPLYYPENCILLGEYYESQGEQKRAKFLFEKAIELKPDTPTTELAMRLAEVYLKQGKYEEAKAICPEELEPDDVEQLLSIGQLYYQLGRPDKAEAHFAAYVQKGSRSNRAQQVAWFYHEHGERGLTEQYLRKALDITPTFHGPYRGLGWLYFSYGDPENAIRLMDEGIRAFPSEFDLKGIKAMILALSDPSDQPGKAFAALEAERPDMAQIGTCLNLMRAKKYEEATAAYQTINKEIKDWWAPRMLKFAYVRMLIAKGDIDAAMDVIGRGDTWIFSYPLLYGDDTLAPLRETERFRAFVQRKFPEKAGKM